MKKTTRKLPYRVLTALSGSRIRFDVIVENDYEPIPGKPIIFAANHSNSFDMPIILRAIKRNTYMLLGKQRLGIADRLFFYLNGAFYVDRLDSADTKRIKDVLTGHLLGKKNILWFPEGTWNMTDNLLMLPMKWGIIEVARRAGAQIIPLSLAYDRDANTCKVRYGAPITGKALDDKAASIEGLRDTMASLRWEQMCDAGVFSRAELDATHERANIRRAIEEYPPLQPEYEEQCVFHVPETEQFTTKEPEDTHHA